MTGDEAPIPALAPAFEIEVEHGTPVEVGPLTIGGRRIYFPVTGGRFAGEGLEGRLIGGGETLFERSDGVTVMEASYYIACAGTTVRAFGSGYRTGDGDFLGTRMTLMFEAGEPGPLAHLATRVFIAEQPAGSAVLAVARIV